ncbi:hypothetical protein LINPERHAP2_LOCUS42192 [Linum perenne]
MNVIYDCVFNYPQYNYVEVFVETYLGHKILQQDEAESSHGQSLIHQSTDAVRVESAETHNAIGAEDEEDEKDEDEDYMYVSVDEIEDEQVPDENSNDEDDIELEVDCEVSSFYTNVTRDVKDRMTADNTFFKDAEHPDWDPAMDIYLGQIFILKEAVQTALKHHELKRNTQYVVAESSPTTLVVKCKLHVRYDCKWMVRVSRKNVGAFWKVRKVCNIHTCTNDYQQGGHRQLYVNIISDSLRTTVMIDPMSPRINRVGHGLSLCCKNNLTIGLGCGMVYRIDGARGTGAKNDILSYVQICTMVAQPPRSPRSEEVALMLSTAVLISLYKTERTAEPQLKRDATSQSWRTIRERFLPPSYHEDKIQDFLTIKQEWGSEDRESVDDYTARFEQLLPYGGPLYQDPVAQRDHYLNGLRPQLYKSLCTFAWKDRWEAYHAAMNL